MRRLPLLLAAGALLPAAARAATADPDVVSVRSGSVTATADQSLAVPGGLFVVRLRSSSALGVAYAMLDGRRCSFFPGRRGTVALVPIPATLAPGTHALGVELRSRRRVRRLRLLVRVRERRYAGRTVVLPEAKRVLAIEPGVVRDGRRVQALLRTPPARRQWDGPFDAPVSVPPSESYGAPTSYEGAFPVERNTDAIYGEYHRGLDYEVPPGTPLRAPAGGTVLMSDSLTLTGQTLVIDHGQSVVSVFFHLGRIEVGTGQTVARGTRLGLSGESGLAERPHLHWGVYVSGVAIDPRVMERVDP
jgi:hypothetical protein